MKKLVLTIAIVLTMGLGAFAQYDDGSLLGKSPLGNYRDNLTDPDIPLMLPSEHGANGDVPGNPTPLGSGVAVLLGLGAAYVVAKKRKEE